MKEEPTSSGTWLDCEQYDLQHQHRDTLLQTSIASNFQQLQSINKKSIQELKKIFARRLSKERFTREKMYFS